MEAIQMLTEEQKQEYLKWKAERERLLKTDPEYRAKYEKHKREFQEHGAKLMGCVIEDTE